MSDTSVASAGPVARFNLKFARRATLVFGTMWFFYACVVYGALGAVFPKYQAGLLYWSNWVQLWSLPLLMVGAYVLGQDSERRQRETHDAVIETRDTVVQEIAMVREDHAATAGLVGQLHDLHLRGVWPEDHVSAVSREAAP